MEYKSNNYWKEKYHRDNRVTQVGEAVSLTDGVANSVTVENLEFSSIPEQITKCPPVCNIAYKLGGREKNKSTLAKYVRDNWARTWQLDFGKEVNEFGLVPVSASIDNDGYFRLGVVSKELWENVSKPRASHNEEMRSFIEGKKPFSEEQDFKAEQDTVQERANEMILAIEKSILDDKSR